MKARRIIVRLDPRPVGLQALARLAEELDAELLGLLVENVELLRLAALPFAREVGHASGVRREMDIAAMERSLQARARELRRACAEALKGSTVSWSFRVARGFADGRRWSCRPARTRAPRRRSCLSPRSPRRACASCSRPGGARS